MEMQGERTVTPTSIPKSMSISVDLCNLACDESTTPDGRYLIQGLLGSGGEGRIYSALDQHAPSSSCSSAEVVVKIIQMPSEQEEQKKTIAHQRSLSVTKHCPYIVRVHDVQTAGNKCFTIMVRRFLQHIRHKLHFTYLYFPSYDITPTGKV